jgi:hypothetical protein
MRISKCGGLYSLLVRSKTALSLSHDLLVADVEGLDPPLLSEGKADEEAELDQLRVGKVCVQRLPEGVIGDGGVPDNGAGVGEGSLLSLAELVGLLKMQQTGILCLWNASRS